MPSCWEWNFIFEVVWSVSQTNQTETTFFLLPLSVVWFIWTYGKARLIKTRCASLKLVTERHSRSLVWLWYPLFRCDSWTNLAYYCHFRDGLAAFVHLSCDSVSLSCGTRQSRRSLLLASAWSTRCSSIRSSAYWTAPYSICCLYLRSGPYWWTSY